MFFADELCQRVLDKKSPLCVGIDPRFDLLPNEFKNLVTDKLWGEIDLIRIFCTRVISIIEPYAAVVKFQSACFERYGHDGFAALEQLVNIANRHHLLTIWDAKRGDIKESAEDYAHAFKRLGADAITLNIYMGSDVLTPFLRLLGDGKGLFCLVRTSNPSARMLQDLIGADGSMVFHKAAALVRESTVASGTTYDSVGAVVGCTAPAELAIVRQLLPRSILLVPGYGKQGGAAADCRGAFQNGMGAIVNSSRGIISCFDQADAAWAYRIEEAAKAAALELQAVAQSTC